MISPLNSPDTDPPLRILLVEDSLPFAMLVIQQLRKEFSGQHVVEHVATLQYAIQWMKDGKPDLVILDLNLPDSDGLQTLQTMQRAAPQIPIVILSSDESEDLAILAVQRGAEDYLCKGTDSQLKLSRSLRFALERKKRLEIEREVNAARRIQQNLLPNRGPVCAGLDIQGALYPALETAGDYYDFIVPMPAIGPDTVGLAIGDVSGHGLGPAMVMAETRACLRALALREPKLETILESTNNVLLQSRTVHFVTMFLAYIDQGYLHYASAGHCCYRLKQNGEVTRLTSTGLPLGIDDSETYTAASPVKLDAGDILLMTTDGVQEAFSPDRELFGLKRATDYVLNHRAEPAQQIVHGLYESIRDFCADLTQEDDITIVIGKVIE